MLDVPNEGSSLLQVHARRSVREPTALDLPTSDGDVSASLFFSRFVALRDQCLASAGQPWYWPKLLVAGLFVGGIFGMMGSGGSMITKPILYYGFNKKPFRLAIFDTYVILFLLAFFGAVRGHSKGRVSWPYVGLLATFTSGFGNFLGSSLACHVTSETQLRLFAMLVVIVSMRTLSEAWLPKKFQPEGGNGPDIRRDCGAGAEFSPTAAPTLSTMTTTQLTITAFTATAVGVLCGLVGVGGGFLLTPLLCYLGHELDAAVASSLAVICLSSISGIIWYMHFFQMHLGLVDPLLEASLGIVGCVGITYSDFLAGRMPKHLRQQMFAMMLLMIGVIGIYTSWEHKFISVA